VVKEVMMMNYGRQFASHMWLCVAGVAAMVAALTLGLGGGWVVLPLVGCATIMTMMIWMMLRGTGQGSDQRHRSS
jgi:hypothetical protein